MGRFDRPLWWSDFFQAEDGIRDVERSRGLGDVYKRQEIRCPLPFIFVVGFLLLKFHKLEAFYYFESKEMAVGFGERWFPNLNLPFHTLNLK